MNKLYFSEELNKEFLDQFKAQLQERFSDCKKIAIKIHFGEPGNNYSLTPDQVKPIINIVNELKIDFFLYDSSVSYESPRSNPESHKKVAIEKGWGELGEIKTDDEFIKVRAKNQDYKVCKPLAEADAVLIISHLKGHVCCGFGGAIKNLGMGALSKESKQSIHNGGQPKIIKDCKQCGRCVEACPINGIKLTDKPEFMECYGCSNCVYECPHGVLQTKLNYFDILLSEGANAAQSQFKKYFYITLINNITKECDCESDPKGQIAKNVGFIFGPDAVAMDKACHDLILQRENKDVFLEKNKKSALKHIKAAQDIGMGSVDYELIIMK